MNAKTLFAFLCCASTTLFAISLVAVMFYSSFFYLETGDLEYRTNAAYAFGIFLVINIVYIAGKFMAYRRFFGSWDFLDK